MSNVALIGASTAAVISLIIFLFQNNNGIYLLIQSSVNICIELLLTKVRDISNLLIFNGLSGVSGVI